MRLIFPSLLAVSLIASLQGFTQTEYCLPIEKARLLVADAMARKSLDSMVVELNGKVALLEADKIKSKKTFNDLLSVERSLVKVERNIAKENRKISDSYKDEVKHLKKKVKSRAWQRNGAAGIALVFLVLAVIP